MNIKQQITEQLFTKSGKVNSAVLRQEWFTTSELAREIIAATPWLPNASFSERIFNILNDFHDHVKCPVCGSSDVAWSGGKYKNTCSLKCAAELRQGDDDLKSKLKSAHIAKAMLTGNERLLSVGDCLEFVHKYKVEEHATSLTISRNKDFVHSLKHYTDWLPLSAGYSERMYVLQHNIAQPVGCNVCGSPTSFISWDDGYRKCCNKNDCVSAFNAHQKRATTLTHITNRNYNGVHIENMPDGVNEGPVEFMCDACNRPFTRLMNNGKKNDDVLCPHCNRVGTSMEEQSLIQWCKSVLHEDVIDHRNIPGTNLELDVYIPSINLAIEYDGIFWHSYDRTETAKERNKHIHKTELCESLGITCIHLFSNEWMQRRDVVKSRLLQKFGKTPNVLNARQLKIVTVSSTDGREFFSNNHLQGADNASVYYGLRDGENLVSVMSFLKPRFTKSYQWELSRFATVLNTRIRGGANKLFSHFIKTHNPDSVVTYSDRRWGAGIVYNNMGFTFDGNTPIGYQYVKGDYVHNRMKFQKHKLEKLLNQFNADLSESQNMFNNGYRRIWDCGHTRWAWSKN
jgi:DNA-directed RNA polymerase subunit RPC12/RpoP